MEEMYLWLVLCIKFLLHALLQPTLVLLLKRKKTREKEAREKNLRRVILNRSYNNRLL